MQVERPEGSSPQTRWATFLWSEDQAGGGNPSFVRMLQEDGVREDRHAPGLE